MPEEPSVYKYVQDYNYYADLYDQLTVEECRNFEKRLSSYTNEKDNNKISPQERMAISKIINSSGIYFMSGERYAHKDEVIREWISRDQKRDEKLEKALPLQGIRCLVCGTFLNCISKDLVGEEERELKKKSKGNSVRNARSF